MPRLPILILSSLGLLVGAPVASSRDQGGSRASGQITVRCTEILKAEDITNGSVSGRGRFTFAGAITDKGRVTDYRTANGSTALVRRVAVGARGTITFLITIHLGTSGPQRWKVISATRGYKGLHGKGWQIVDKYYETPATFVLSGTVSR